MVLSWSKAKAQKQKQKKKQRSRKETAHLGQAEQVSTSMQPAAFTQAHALQRGRRGTEARQHQSNAEGSDHDEVWADALEQFQDERGAHA